MFISPLLIKTLTAPLTNRGGPQPPREVGGHGTDHAAEGQGERRAGQLHSAGGGAAQHQAHACSHQGGAGEAWAAKPYPNTEKSCKLNPENRGLREALWA